MGEVTTRAMSLWSAVPVRRRRYETALTRLRTGHMRLTQGYLTSRDIQPYFDDCLVSLTLRHLLVECLSLEDLRERYLSLCLSLSDTGREMPIHGA